MSNKIPDFTDSELRVAEEDSDQISVSDCVLAVLMVQADNVAQRAGSI